MPAGWLEWEHDGKPSLQTAFYAEFNSSGPGANPSARDPHAVQLSPSQAAEFEVRRFLAGEDGWDTAHIR